MVTGKALDDRGGCAVLIEALRHMKDVKATVHAVFTVQEEVGLKGGKTSAFGLDPDVVLVSEVTFAGDHPGIEKKDSALEIGKGPAITVSDSEGRAAGQTDASIIHLSGEGIPTGIISTPSRYIHTPVTVPEQIPNSRLHSIT